MDGEIIQFLLPLVPNRVHEENRYKNWEFLHYHAEHPDEASSHVFKQDWNSTADVPTRLLSKTCFFSIVHGQHVVRGQCLTLDRIL